jgi:hypothetical protein
LQFYQRLAVLWRSMKFLSYVPKDPFLYIKMSKSLVIDSFDCNTYHVVDFSSISLTSCVKFNSLSDGCSYLLEFQFFSYCHNFYLVWYHKQRTKSNT